MNVPQNKELRAQVSVVDDSVRALGQTRFWLVVILAGFAARLWLWWISTGSNDAETWYQFGNSIASDGLNATYEKLPFFNHPPLMGLYAEQTCRWSQDFWSFTHLLKLPGLVGEALILWALWRFASPAAAVAYAWLPAAILVSGFHGNTDCLYVALVLVAVIAFDRRLFFVAGLLMAAALNVKLIPLMLLPMFFIGLPNWRALGMFSAGLSIVALPYIPPALDVGPEMYRNMLLYNSNADNWGLILLLRWCARIPDAREFFAGLIDDYLVVGRYVALGAITAVALLSRFRSRQSLAEQAALGAALFLLLTPGFGVQYVVFVAPLLCLVDIPAALRWGCASGLFIGCMYWYFRIPGPHLAAQQTSDYPVQVWSFGVVAWLVLLHFVWRHAPRRTVAA